MIRKILVGIITAAGIAILLWAFSIFEESREALSWPQIKGKVVSSSLSIENAPDLTTFTNRMFRWYRADVEYEYFVAGNPYFSKTLSFQKGNTRNPRAALRVMNKYRHLRQVTVYYNPKNPFDSVLEPEDIGDIYIPVMIGGMLVFCGLMGFYSRPLEIDRGVDSHIYQGQIYQDQGKIEEAFWQYTQAIKNHPNLAAGYNNRGNLYLYYQHWDHAIADFEKALTIDPNDGLTYFTLAKAYSGKGQYVKALENMQKAMEKGFSVKPEIFEDLKSKVS